MRRFRAVALVGLAAVGPARGQDMSWPTRGWPTASPEAQGVDADRLAVLDREFASGQHGYVDGMLIVRGGRLVYQKAYTHDYDRLFPKETARGPYNYYDPDWHPYYRRGELHTMQSVSKSVTATLVGIALRRGEIGAVSDLALPYFEGYKQPLDPRWKGMTLRHLLTMSAGIRWDESSVSYTDPANHCARMEQSQDWIQFVLDQPLAADPGTVFVYNSGVTELLAQVLKRATGKHADAYAAEHLFGPLGIQSFYWKKTPTGHPDTEGGLYLTAGDLAKLGLLYAKDGMWDGRRILPEGFARDATAPHIETLSAGVRRRKYGFQWWVLPDPEGARVSAFAALGYGGQRLIVAPERDLIAVFTGWNIYDKAELGAFLALDRVLAALTR